MDTSFHLMTEAGLNERYVACLTYIGNRCFDHLEAVLRVTPDSDHWLRAYLANDSHRVEALGGLSLLVDGEDPAQVEQLVAAVVQDREYVQAATVALERLRNQGPCH